MSNLADSDHFIHLNQLPSFDASTPALKVYRQLAKLGRGEFILTEGGRRQLVRAKELAQTTIISMPQHAKGEISSVKATIGSLAAGPGAESAVIPLEHTPVADTSEPGPLMEGSDEKAYCVLHEGREIGYFVSQTSMIEPATKRIYYVCSNGHRNTDPDHGFCYSCPAEIENTETE